MSWSKAKKREYNLVWMRRRRGGTLIRKYIKRGAAGWNNLFKVVRKGA